MGFENRMIARGFIIYFFDLWGLDCVNCTGGIRTKEKTEHNIEQVESAKPSEETCNGYE